jgi:hypothetical protein
VGYLKEKSTFYIRITSPDRMVECASLQPHFPSGTVSQSSSHPVACLRCPVRPCYIRRHQTGIRFDRLIA